MPFDIVDLGTLDYASALSLQREAHDAVVAGARDPVLFFVEHPPVITVSKRARGGGNLLADPAQLERLGIAVEPTDRGGDVTYHGPGQLVAYPILPLQPFELRASSYMHLLERVVIDAIARFGIEGHTIAGMTGVWTATSGTGANSQAKICAMGVRIRKSVTMHGIALNVTTNLDHFNTIVPCGLEGTAVTSMRELLSDDTPSMPAVQDAFADALRHALLQRAVA